MPWKPHKYAQKHTHSRERKLKLHSIRVPPSYLHQLKYLHFQTKFFNSTKHLSEYIPFLDLFSSSKETLMLSLSLKFPNREINLYVTLSSLSTCTIDHDSLLHSLCHCSVEVDSLN